MQLMDTPTCWAPNGCHVITYQDLRSCGQVFVHEPAEGFWGHRCELVVEDILAAQSVGDHMAHAYRQWVIEIHQRPNVIEQ
jgi:hypothetical protein